MLAVALALAELGALPITGFGAGLALALALAEQVSPALAALGALPIAGFAAGLALTLAAALAVLEPLPLPLAAALAVLELAVRGPRLAVPELAVRRPRGVGLSTGSPANLRAFIAALMRLLGFGPHFTLLRQRACPPSTPSKNFFLHLGYCFDSGWPC